MKGSRRVLVKVVLFQLTDSPAVSDTLRTDGGRQIWTKLGQGGQYITPRYPDLKKPLFGPRGGFLGTLKFLFSGNWVADFSHY